jgi:hypothetical protein
MTTQASFRCIPKRKELTEMWIQLPGKRIQNIDSSLILQPVIIFRMYKRFSRTTDFTWVPTVFITHCILTFMYESLSYWYVRLSKFVSLTFMAPCIVRIFWYISNKMQRYTVYLYLETALHVSCGTTTHHQERKQLLSTASGICQTITATCRQRQVAVTFWQIPDAVHKSCLRSWWWVVVPPETCRAVSR